MFIHPEAVKMLDKTLYFKYSLLAFFEQQEKYTTHELAQLAQIDARSVTKYIQELEKSYKIYSQGQRQLFIHRRGYQLLLPVYSQEMLAFQLHLIQTNTSYQLWDALVFQQMHTVATFAVNHFISESTTNRSLSRIKDVLKSYNVVVNRGNYFLTGDETTVRMAIQLIYWRLFHGNCWPFSLISLTQVKHIATHITAFFHIELNSMKQHRLEYLLGTALVRRAQQHRIEGDVNWQMYVEDNPVFYEFVQQLQSEFPAYYQEKSELAYIFLVLMTREEYYNSPRGKALYVFHQHHQTPADCAVRFSIEQLVMSESKQLPKEVYGYLLSGHVFAHVFPAVPYGINGGIFWSDMQERYPALLKRVAAYLQDASNATDNPAFLNQSFLLERYSTVLKSMAASELLPRMTLLLLTDLPVFEEKQLINELLASFKNDYQLVIDTYVDRQDSYDLVLANYKDWNLDVAYRDEYIFQQELKGTDYQQLHLLLQQLLSKN